MQDEETDLGFANVGTSPAPKRPYTAPLLSDDPDSENAPDLTGRGRSHFLEHETGLAGGLRPRCASRAKLGREPATPTLAKGRRGKK